MDDLVYVQIFCTDSRCFDKFNSHLQIIFYERISGTRVYWRGSLLRGGHFELQAIAVSTS